MLKRASAFAASEDVALTTARSLLRPAERTGVAWAATARDREEGRELEKRREPPDVVQGATFRVAIESGRYPGFCYGRGGAVMVSSNLAFSLGRQGTSALTFASRERLKLAGFARQEWIDLLAGAAYLVEEPRGLGRIILFAEDPNFRGYWESLSRMFLNSVVLAPSFGESESRRSHEER